MYPDCSEPITEPEVLESIERLLTEDDLPYDDGEPMETVRHRDQMILLIESIKAYWAERTNYYAGGNMFLHFDPANKRRCRGPDFFLVLDVEDRERKSWVVWQEGMRFPDLIVELLSDTTRETDLGEKKELYERLFRTPEYYVYDPFDHSFTGFRLEVRRYREVAPDAEGRIYSPVTGLYLGMREGWLRWITPEGKILPSPWELAEQKKNA